MLSGSRWQHRYSVLSVSVLAYFAIRFVEFVLSIVFADIKATLDVTTFVLGIGVATSTLTYAVAQLPSGAIGDHVGHRSVVAASLGLTGLAALLLATAPTGGVVVLGMALVGLVSGAYYSPATAVLAEQFDETARAIGIHRLGAQAVGIFGPIVGIVGARYGWRAILTASGLVALPALLGYLAAVPSRAVTAREVTLRERLSARTLADILSRRDVAFTTLIASLAQFVDTATFSFLPLILREYAGRSIGTAAWLFTGYFVAVAVSQPLAGWMVGRLRRDVVTATALSLALLGYLVIVGRPAGAGIAVGVVAVGLGMGWAPPVQAGLVDALPDGERGAGFGLVRSLYIGFAAVNGVVVGGAVTIGGWRLGLTVLLGTLAASIALLPVRLLVTRRRNGST